jgi:phage-related protein
LEKYLPKKEKNDTFRALYNEKIPDAFRVYCFAVVLKKTNTFPMKDANWFNTERNFK